jgi:hypothetical protein
MTSKSVLLLPIVLYGAIGGWLVYAAIAGSNETADVPSWWDPFLHSVLFAGYGLGALVLRRATTAGRRVVALLVPVLFLPVSLAMLIVAEFLSGGRF